MVDMFILKIPYAPMVSVSVGVGALVPMVGAFAAAVIGAFMILTVSPIKAVVFIVFIIYFSILKVILYTQNYGRQNKSSAYMGACIGHNGRRIGRFCGDSFHYFSGLCYIFSRFQSNRETIKQTCHYKRNRWFIKK